MNYVLMIVPIRALLHIKKFDQSDNIISCMYLNLIILYKL